jgi:hypothetical protein
MRLRSGILGRVTRQIGVALLPAATVVLFVVGLGAMTEAMSVTTTRSDPSA